MSGEGMRAIAGTLGVLIFIYLVAAVFWAVRWYSEYDSNSGEYYAEERKTAARNFLLTR